MVAGGQPTGGGGGCQPLDLTHQRTRLCQSPNVHVPVRARAQAERCGSTGSRAWAGGWRRCGGPGWIRTGQSCDTREGTWTPTTNEPEPDAAWHRSHRNRPEAAHPSRTPRAWQGWRCAVRASGRTGAGTSQPTQQPSPAQPERAWSPAARAKSKITVSAQPFAGRLPEWKRLWLGKCRCLADWACPEPER